MANEKYLNLITSQHATKTKYMQYVETFLEMLEPALRSYEEFSDIFNVDKVIPESADPANPEPGTTLSTIDDQLDMLGQIVGISRTLPVVDPDIPTILDNKTYQRVLKAKINMNNWNGTIESLSAILESAFPNLMYDIVDGQDMSYMIVVLNPEVSALETALLMNGFLLPKPSGVRINYTILDEPIFGWDSNTAAVKGWDEGTWS